MRFKPYLQWQITRLPANYREQAGDTAADQIAKAGFRFAALIRAVWPDDRAHVAP